MERERLDIPVEGASLQGELIWPVGVSGLVIFAHGSGSSRHSPRNQQVAATLRKAGLGTLLFDLLTVEEERAEARTGHLRFNIDFLAKRLEGATRWVLDRSLGRRPKVGYFGSSTGAAAALVAAAEMGPAVGAIVSRGGRPDLAAAALEKVSAPTLLIVGGEDGAVISLNEQACVRLRCPKALRIIPGATHLFPEPGALEGVASMASEWFLQHLQT